MYSFSLRVNCFVGACSIMVRTSVVFKIVKVCWRNVTFVFIFPLTETFKHFCTSHSPRPLGFLHLCRSVTVAERLLALQRKSHLCIPFLGIARPQPNFHFHVSMSDLYSSRIGLHISSNRIGRPIVGIYKSLTDA